MTLPVQSARCRRPLVTYLLISMGLLSFITKAAVPPPQAQIIPHKLTAQGETRIDNYYWLRDDGRQNKQVLAYLTAENRYTEQVMQPHQTLRDRLYHEMLGRMSPEDRSVPYRLNGYRYQESIDAGKEFAVYQRQPVAGDSAWQTLLDANQRTQGQDYYRVGGLAVS